MGRKKKDAGEGEPAGENPGTPKNPPEETESDAEGFVQPPDGGATGEGRVPRSGGGGFYSEGTRYGISAEFSNGPGYIHIKNINPPANRQIVAARVQQFATLKGWDGTARVRVARYQGDKYMRGKELFVMELRPVPHSNAQGGPSTSYSIEIAGMRAEIADLRRRLEESARPQSALPETLKILLPALVPLALPIVTAMVAPRNSGGGIGDIAPLLREIMEQSRSLAEERGRREAEDDMPPYPAAAPQGMGGLADLLPLLLKSPEVGALIRSFLPALLRGGGDGAETAPLEA